MLVDQVLAPPEEADRPQHLEAAVGAGEGRIGGLAGDDSRAPRDAVAAQRPHPAADRGEAEVFVARETQPLQCRPPQAHELPYPGNAGTGIARFAHRTACRDLRWDRPSVLTAHVRSP